MPAPNAEKPRHPAEDLNPGPTALDFRFVILDRNQLFRQVNDRIADVGFDELDLTTELREFLCECGRAGCRELFALTFDTYRAARRSPDCFLVAPGHDDPAHDRVLERFDAYWIVEAAPAAVREEITS